MACSAIGTSLSLEAFDIETREIPLFKVGGAVAWWLTPRTPDPEVWGSSPTRVAVLCP